MRTPERQAMPDSVQSNQLFQQSTKSMALTGMLRLRILRFMPT